MKSTASVLKGLFRIRVLSFGAFLSLQLFLSATFILSFTLLCAPPAEAHDYKPGVPVHGRVLDERGVPLAGVSVNLKGTNTGTATDQNGAFSLALPDAKGVLVFSFVGYIKQEVAVGGRTDFVITLKQDISTLSDVVVIGYGTQKKVNLTGAVDQISGKVLENKPLPNLTRGLEGVIPNLNIKMTDGKPIRSADYNVRGATSIGAGGSALVLIDGVPGDPNMVNPNDVASISVLKDAASAAIYGARG
ncbi:MAG TPA: carboxypeptidase-like regulatory domain-containing protein, partial [Flavisolibacter sp.]|nr:carboxypeptidase-like regulatory domain-containing protein [Flavisolibacter sp.]